MRDVGAALVHEPRREREHERADRNVDEEDPRPAERARERAAEQHAGRAAAARDRAPDAEREVALAAFLERRRQDRQRGRREQRRAEPLQRAERDQRALRPGEAVEQRADREEREPDHEEPAAAEQVGHPSAEQQHAAEQDRVGGHDPLQALLAEVQVGLDRRQRDVHDRHVEHDHELCGDDHRQGDPPPPVGAPPPARACKGTHLGLLSVRTLSTESACREWRSAVRRVRLSRVRVTELLQRGGLPARPRAAAAATAAATAPRRGVEEEVVAGRDDHEQHEDRDRRRRATRQSGRCARRDDRGADEQREADVHARDGCIRVVERATRAST